MTAATKKPRAAGFTKEVPEATPTPPATDPFARLKEPFPEAMHKQGKMDSEGHTGTYVEWYDICDRIEEVDPMWQHEVTVTYGVVAGQVVCSATASVSILGVTRMGHSSRVVNPATIGKDGKSNETSALQRAAAKFGLTRYLYKRGWSEAGFRLTEEQMANLASVYNLPLEKFHEKATEILGRPITDLDTDTFTASELDILIAAGGK